jgi:hypothetical protein
MTLSSPPTIAAPLTTGYVAIRRINGQPVPRHMRPWRPNPVDGDWVLLAEIGDDWPKPRDGFDGTSIYCRAFDQPQLRAALAAATGAKFRKDGHPTKGALARIQRWLDRNVGRQLGGLTLLRDERGWCRVTPPADTHDYRAETCR